MASKATEYDAIVIGGGFYGASIAIYLRKNRGLKRILLLEREPTLLQRSSYNNQARVHNGYHYPRSYTTAFRSRVNLPKFLRDWPLAVRLDFTKLYAIARRNSKVTSKQFERFCSEIGAKLRKPEPSLKNLFDERLVESIYAVDEFAFDSTKLAVWAKKELEELTVDVLLNSRALDTQKTGDSHLRVTVARGDSETIQYLAPLVFNCTYSGLNQFSGDFPGTLTKLKHEITEMALIDVPEPLKGLGITVMDGPFFSVMPFPARGLHTLSHVRYTPHMSWDDAPDIDPYKRLKDYEKNSRVDWMLRDVSRYVPAISQSKYKDSLFEVKTILTKSEGDDGRPILFERHADLPGCYSILGGKIDNIYDVLEKLDSETFNMESHFS